MKTIQLSLVTLLMLTCTTLIGQSKKQLEREKNKVEVFTVEERANLQLYFYEKTKAMDLSEEVEEEYYMYILQYVYDMQRLNDKDKDYTDEEIKTELTKLIDKIDTKVKPILTDEQFKMHKANWEALLKSVYLKNGWEWSEE